MSEVWKSLFLVSWVSFYLANMPQGYKSLEAIKYLVCFNYIAMVIFFCSVLLLQCPRKRFKSIIAHFTVWSLHLLRHLVFNFKRISNLIITPPYSVIFIQWDPSFHTEGEGGFNPFLMELHAYRDVRSHFTEVLEGKCGFVSLESITQCRNGIYTAVSSGPPCWLAEQRSFEKHHNCAQHRW